MYSCDLNDTVIKKDSWIKNVKKTYNPELLADLIKKRIEFPHSTGPLYRFNSDELPSDIIDTIIAYSQENRDKLAPAVGLLLYNMIHGKLTETYDLLQNIFSIIQNSKLTECETLVREWMFKNGEMTTSHDVKRKRTYRNAMMAYAVTQSKDLEIESWWLRVWRGSVSTWWLPSFMGLRVQNPALACNELRLLVDRKSDNIDYILLGTWYDRNARALFESSIRNGIEENAPWAGFALNTLLGKLALPERDVLMMNLKTATSPEVTC